MTKKRNFGDKFLIPIAATLLGIVVLLVWLYVPPLTSIVEVDGQEVEEIILNWSLLTSLLAIVYFVFSFRFLDPVQANEIAVLLFFGRPFGERESGAIFAPLFFVQPVRLNINFEQEEFPAEPERIWRPTEAQMGDEAPEGYKPPVRITFRESVDDNTAKKLLGHRETAEEDFADLDTYYRWGVVDKDGKIIRKYTFNAGAPDDGLGRRVTAEVAFVVRWRIYKGQGINYIVNVDNRANFLKQVEDEMVSVLQRLLPNISVGQALENIAWINAILFRRVCQRTADWGVIIEGAYLKQIQLHRGLNSAIADLSESFYTGQADKEVIIRKGEGEAIAARELAQRELEGRAAGYSAIAKTTQSESGRQAQAADVARVIGESESTVIVGKDGFANLLGLGTALIQKGDQNKNRGGKTDDKNTSSGGTTDE